MTGSHDALWVAVYTKPLAERIVERVLLGKRYPVYLPMHPRRPKPLFARYLFVNIQGRRWSPVQHAHGVVYIVKTTPGHLSVVSPEALEIVRQQVLAELPPDAPDAVTTPFSTLDRVRIIEGAAAGLVGIVQRSTAERTKILLDIAFNRLACTVPTASLDRA